MSILENLSNQQMDSNIENFDSDSDLIGGHIGYKFSINDSSEDTHNQSINIQDGGLGYQYNLKGERIGGLPEVTGYKPCQVDGCESKRVMDAVSQEGGKKRKNTRHRNIVINTKKLSRRRQAKIVVKKN